MKKHLHKKTLWQSLLSVVVFGVFVYFAVGSLGGISQQTTHLGNGVYETAKIYSDGKEEILTGKVDEDGRWNGEITIEYMDDFGNPTGTETVNMINGKRDGESKTIYPNGTYSIQCYKMDEKIECEKSANISEADMTAFQLLSDKYPWFIFKLNAFGFEDAYVEAYMDTLETVLNATVFELEEFDDYYEDVITILEETPYDSIISLNSMSTFFYGLELLKDSELRLAVIDRYRLDSSTFIIVKTTYPGYLLSLQEGEVNEQDFEVFCQSLDDSLTSYGSLDLEDPFFIDSVDARMFRAINSIYSAEEPLKSAVVFSDNEDLRSIYSIVKSILKPSSLNSSPGEVAEVVLFYMLIQFDQADLIKQAVMKAYLMNNGVVSIPTVTTEFSSNNSATSVTMNGYVIEDGGAAVTSRGIAWATFYNPTTNEPSETSGTGTGSFAVTLNNLTEGTTYYARSYAINSAGTAYGNCITFTAASTSGMESIVFAQDLKVYPNPASALTTFSFQLESSESMELIIVDMKGQVVFHNDLGSLPPGENQVKLDISGLRNGMYHCQLTNNGTIKVTRKLVIAR